MDSWASSELASELEVGTGNRQRHGTELRSRLWHWIQELHTAREWGNPAKRLRRGDQRPVECNLKTTSKTSGIPGRNKHNQVQGG